MKTRTLIVDDELLARERLRQLLQNEPEIEIVGECADGREAVAAIRKMSPDLIFLDIQMPELDGFGVLEAIRGEPAPVIVFVTAHDRFAVRAFEVHAVDYLLKPFDRERFQTALRHALGQSGHHLPVSPVDGVIPEEGLAEGGGVAPRVVHFGPAVETQQADHFFHQFRRMAAEDPQ